MNDRIGFVVMTTKGQPIRTGRRLLPNAGKAGRKPENPRKKSPKIYRCAGQACKVARETKAALGVETMVLCASINIDNPNRFFHVGYAVIGADGRPVRTGAQEATAKLYQHSGKAGVVAEATHAKVVDVYV